MANLLFVDSSAWIALADSGDRYHGAAAEAYPTFLRRYRKLVTTNLVVAETYILLRRGLGPSAALSFLQSLRTSIRMEKVYSSPSLESKAEEILRRYEDQRFSFADAVSFALMEERDLKLAFSFDEHFVVAGFQLAP